MVNTEDTTSNIRPEPEKRMLAPCDCVDRHTASLLEFQGIGHNNETIMVMPNYVELTLGHTTVKISMARFKMFAEWYLEPQELKDRPF